MTLTNSQLTEVFPPEMERTLNKGGTNFTYIPVSEIITRLNKVLGVEQWSFTVERCERDAIDPDFVIAHVRLVWNVAGAAEVIRDGIGGQKIKRTKAGIIVDLGDEFKGAISDALKKAAQTLGVGLYLARSDDAIEIEQVIDDQYSRPEQPPVDPEHLILWSNFTGMTQKLTDDGKKKLRQKWETFSNNAPAPSGPSVVTSAELVFLIEEAAIISLGGVPVAVS